MISRMNFSDLVIDAAANGLEALERVEHEPVDVIITDICMPKMDGLAFLSKVKRKDADIRTIILSGYDDFTYARKAIHLGCRDYLLKPPSYQDLQQLLQQVFNQIAADRSQRLKHQQEKLLSMQSRLMMRSEWMSRLLLGRKNVTADTVRAEAAELGLDLSADDYRLVLFRFDGVEACHAGWKEQDWHLAQFAISNITQELCRNGHCFDHDHDQLVVLIEDDGLTDDEVLALCQSVQANVRRYLRLSLSSAVSDRTTLISLHQAYQQCKLTLKYVFLDGKESRRTWSQVRAMPMNPAVSAVSRELDRLRECDFLAALAADLQQTLKQIESMEMSPPQLEALSGQWKLLMLGLIDRWAGDDRLPEEYAKHRLMELVEREEVCGNMMEPVLRLLQYIKSQENMRRNENQTIDKAKKFIDEHFCEPLDLQTISEHVYMNPAYFSVLFKKQTGQSVTQYITEKRLKRAQELLRKPEYKTYQVAEKVGYENAAYFSTLFKKHTGFTPQDYRNRVN